MIEWQPISTAPKDGTWVLLYHKGAKLHEWYWDGGIWTDDDMRNGLEWSDGEYGPTHWMPRPEPPEDLK